MSQTPEYRRGSAGPGVALWWGVDTKLRVATVSVDTEAEGYGRRWALWVQGCPIRCPGCCNPEMFDPIGKSTERSTDELVASMASARSGGVEGITVLGGEPFEQAEGVLAVARAARALGLTVMVFSGYTLEELRDRAALRPAITELLAVCDILVDGRYDETRPEPPPPIGRRWLGSQNQRIHYFTPAYTAEDPRLFEANTVELHWRDGKLLVNGWPAGADELARRVRLRSIR